MQVVTATDETERTTSSSTFVTASNTLSVSITPSSASNKIFVSVSLGVQSPSDTYAGFITIYRDSTNLSSNYFIKTLVSGTYLMFGGGMSVLDSPSTTSAITYQVYLRRESGAPNDVKINPNSAKGTITAFEIAG